MVLESGGRTQDASEVGAGVPAVEVRDLVKTFPSPEGGSLTAVDGVSFEVLPREVFGFLGPNGAGKTTTLEIIEGLQAPTAGRTLVLGMDSAGARREMKERIGVQLQAGAYFDYLTLEEILALFGSFYRRRVEPMRLLERVGLESKRRALVKELSGGQAQRFSIVAAMVNDPEVLFLDEPTTGLDPQARRNVWDLISSIKRDDGKTVVMTTHYMEEAEVLCDRVAIIDHGKIQALDTVPGLVRGLPVGYRIMVATRPRPVTDELVRGLPGVVRVEPPSRSGFDRELHVKVAGETVAALLARLRDDGLEVAELQVLPATLEDVFLSVTGRSLRE